MRTIPSGAAKFLRAAEVNCARPNKAKVSPNKARIESKEGKRAKEATDWAQLAHGISLITA